MILAQDGVGSTASSAELLGALPGAAGCRSERDSCRFQTDKVPLGGTNDGR